MMKLRDILLRTTCSTMSVSDGGGGAEGGGAGGGGGGAAGAGEGAGGAAGGAGAADKPFYEAFATEDLKTNPSVQKYKTAEELAGAYVNLEKRFGIDPARRIDLPADPNDKDGMRAVYTKLGLPDKPEGYGMALDDKATDADKALLGSFTAKAHELGLPANMAKGVMGFWMEQVAAANKATEEAWAARTTEGKAALQQEFGAAYDARTKEIGDLVGKYGDPELAKMLSGDGLAAYPNVAKMLGKLVDRMAEPGSAGGEGGDAARSGGAMTPAQAKAAARALESDPVKGAALQDRNHPQHKAVVDERLRLLQMAEA